MADKKPERHLYLVRTPEPRSESKPARIHYTPTSGRDEHTRGSSALNHVDGQDYGSVAESPETSYKITRGTVAGLGVAAILMGIAGYFVVSSTLTRLERVAAGEVTTIVDRSNDNIVEVDCTQKPWYGLSAENMHLEHIAAKKCRYVQNMYK